MSCEPGGSSGRHGVVKRHHGDRGCPVVGRSVVERSDLPQCGVGDRAREWRTHCNTRMWSS